jgi:thiamine biosynthesis lipoprotein
VIARLAAPTVAVALCVSCAPAATDEISDGQYHMGTVLQITLRGGDRELLASLFAPVEALEQQMSSYRADSDISKLSASAGQGAQPVQDEVARLLADCIGYSELTGGSFDVTVGPLVGLWTEAGRTGRRPSPADLAEARARVGADKLRIDRAAGTAELLLAGMSVDLGGVAKGTATDAIARMLPDTAALIDFGGSSLHALGAPPGEPGWRILIRNGTGGFVGVATLRDRALSVSSSLGQSVEIDGVRYGHILDPRTGEALRERRVAVAVTSSGELAEVLTKALLILGPEEGLALIEALPDTEALIVEEDGAQHATSGFERMVRFEPLLRPSDETRR